MTFTNNAFTGLTLAKVNDTFAGGITGSLAGNLITITYGGTNAAGTYNAEFTLLGNSAAVPEPSQFALAGVAGLFAAGSWFRRRRRTA